MSFKDYPRVFKAIRKNILICLFLFTFILIFIEGFGQVVKGTPAVNYTVMDEKVLNIIFYAIGGIYSLIILLFTFVIKLSERIANIKLDWKANETQDKGTMDRLTTLEKDFAAYKKSNDQGIELIKDELKDEMRRDFNKLRSGIKKDIVDCIKTIPPAKEGT